MFEDIPEVNTQASARLVQILNNLCITDGGMGILGNYLHQLAGIQGNVCPDTSSWGILIFAADHGVVDEGVSRFASGDTAQMVRGILKGRTAVGVLARQHRLPLVCWDVGLKNELSVESGLVYPLIKERIACGTKNFVHEPAMTLVQCQTALHIGKLAVEKLAPETKIVALGEMGMGNTTSAAALTAVLLHQRVQDVVGMGAGNLDLEHKCSVVAQALKNNKIDGDPVTTLAVFGGFEIAALTGACLAAAAARKAIVLDGFVTATAALVAARINPRVKDYLLPSHLAPEPGHPLVLQELGLKPALNLQLRIGEGAGALLLYPLLCQTSALLSGLATFQELGIKLR